MVNTVKHVVPGGTAPCSIERKCFTVLPDWSRKADFADVALIRTDFHQKHAVQRQFRIAAIFCSHYHPSLPIPEIMSINRQSVEAPVGTLGRAILFGVATFLTGGFALARSLSPDPQGFGTHQQFGLPPCTTRMLFGIPCPGCGMTTCFAHFVRGEFVLAANANLAGVVLAAVCALLIPWSLWSAHRGRLWMVSDPVTFAGVLTICMSGLAVLFWAARLIAVV